MNENTKKIAGVGLLTAIVFVLQLIGGAIHLGPFSVSLVLIPIVVGAALYGKLSGAWLGLAFAVAVFISGDAAAFLTINPFGAVVTVLLKGVLAGFCRFGLQRFGKEEQIGGYCNGFRCLSFG